MDIEKQDKITQQKEILNKIKDLLDDLKTVRSGSVRGFIFDNVYKFMASIETTIDNLFHKNEDLQKEVDRCKSQLETEKRIHKWSTEMMMSLTAATACVDEATLEDQQMDKKLVPFVEALSTEIDNPIPEKEMQLYVNLVNGDLTYAIDKSLSGDVYGKLIYNNEPLSIKVEDDGSLAQQCISGGENLSCESSISAELTSM